MSAIDCIDHVHVGSFNNFASIYWPLVTTTMNVLSDIPSDENVKISPYTLLIGGGSGEHMALRVENDAMLVKLFLRNNLFEELEILKEKDALVSKNVKFSKLLKELQILNKRFEDCEEPLFYSKFNMNDWPMSSFIAVNDAFKELGLLKYNRDEYAFENVLSDAIGAFILEVMPLDAIKSENLRNICHLLRELKSEIEKEIFSFSSYIDRLMLLFDNLDEEGTFGRNFKKYIDAGLPHQWRYSLKDWYEDQK